MKCKSILNFKRIRFGHLQDHLQCVFLITHRPSHDSQPEVGFPVQLQNEISV